MKPKSASRLAHLIFFEFIAMTRYGEKKKLFISTLMLTNYVLTRRE